MAEKKVPTRSAAYNGHKNLNNTAKYAALSEIISMIGGMTDGNIKAS
jgi:hypothetical protein